ncbi:MAG: sulfur carrier protein ThiS [Bacteroidales bacterium]
MIILINNIEHSVSHPASISDVLTTLKIENTKGTAIAVNNQVIPKIEWEKYNLKENDSITVIRATQGG